MHIIAIKKNGHMDIGHLIQVYILLIIFIHSRDYEGM